MAGPADINGVSRTILVIEDDPSITMGLELNLRAEGFHVILAHDGQEGLVQARQDGIDLVILDNWLPDLDGIELCRLIRATDRQTPIIFYSAAGMGSEDREALSSGANAFISKGSGLGSLRQAMADELKKTNNKPPKNP